jgi:hypothetical protein
LQYTLHISPDLAHRLPQAENLINVQIHRTG